MSDESKPKRYFLGMDNSGHWYLVDASKRAEWENWADLDEDDEYGWDPPEFAQGINTSVEQITFAEPEGHDD